MRESLSGRSGHYEKFQICKLQRFPSRKLMGLWENIFTSVRRHSFFGILSPQRLNSSNRALMHSHAFFLQISHSSQKWTVSYQSREWCRTDVKIFLHDIKRRTKWDYITVTIDFANNSWSSRSFQRPPDSDIVNTIAGPGPLYCLIVLHWHQLYDYVIH